MSPASIALVDISSAAVTSHHTADELHLSSYASEGDFGLYGWSEEGLRIGAATVQGTRVKDVAVHVLDPSTGEQKRRWQLLTDGETNPLL
jgi:hypothetical protein